EPVEGAALRRRRLHEHDRLFRDGRSGLLRVAAIVEADAHELARAGDGRSDACVGRYAGQARGLRREQGAELPDAAPREERLVVVREMRGNVEAFVADQDAGLFGAERSEARELHEAAVALVSSSASTASVMPWVESEPPPRSRVRAP